MIIEQIYFPDFEYVDEDMYSNLKESVRQLEELTEKLAKSIDDISRGADSQTVRDFAKNTQMEVEKQQSTKPQ